ncbi:MAG TPA: VRR-NUC domain-containing protein [Candidatus Hydrogenedentes bacterium]|jgi:hypothetical protein|nr:VRR-NUC domain-containing protein [Candidatus Hydrogenedentota bacterium]
MRHNESALQCSCKRWFDYQFPKLRQICFAVPNGSRRDKITGAILKKEGVVSGCPDMILLIARNGFGSLCIEFKTEIGKQSENQKMWQRSAEDAGNKYVICRSFDEFRDTVNAYLHD